MHFQPDRIGPLRGGNEKARGVGGAGRRAGTPTNTPQAVPRHAQQSHALVGLLSKQEGFLLRCTATTLCVHGARAPPRNAHIVRASGAASKARRAARSQAQHCRRGALGGRASTLARTSHVRPQRPLRPRSRARSETAEGLRLVVSDTAVTSQEGPAVTRPGPIGKLVSSRARKARKRARRTPTCPNQILRIPVQSTNLQSICVLNLKIPARDIAVCRVCPVSPRLQHFESGIQKMVRFSSPTRARHTLAAHH